MSYLIEIGGVLLTDAGHNPTFEIGGKQCDAPSDNEAGWTSRIAEFAKSVGVEADLAVGACHVALAHVERCEALHDVNCSGEPNGLDALADERQVVQFEDFMVWLAVVNAQAAAADDRYRQRTTRESPGRAWFQARRDKLLIELLRRGSPYSCAVPGCAETDITVDHIVPLSQGGTNDISNLQLLCRSHNCSKGAKI